MLSIRDGEALAHALRSDINFHTKRLLRKRCQQLGDIANQVHIAIVQPGDTAVDLERALGFSVFRNPADGSWFGEPDWSPGWEWVEDHGSCFEAVFIMDDGGFGHVVIFEKAEGADTDLMALWEACASDPSRTPFQQQPNPLI